MNKPPDTIDGAKVLMYANVDGCKKISAVCHYCGGTLQNSFARIAIRSYGKDDTVYLFHCDSAWETENDDLFDSVKEAIEAACRQYRGLNEKDFHKV